MIVIHIIMNKNQKKSIELEMIHILYVNIANSNGIYFVNINSLGINY